MIETGIFLKLPIFAVLITDVGCIFKHFSNQLVQIQLQSYLFHHEPLLQIRLQQPNFKVC